MSTKAREQRNNDTRIIELQRQNQKNLINSLKVGSGTGSSLQSFGSAGSESGGISSPQVVSNTKTSNLGDIFSNPPVNVDFNIFDDRQLYGNLVGPLLIMLFSNIPVSLDAKLTIYPKIDNPNITIGGTIITQPSSDPFGIGPVLSSDFLDIAFSSSNQVDIVIISVKKNNEITEGGEVIPTVPEDITISGHTNISVDISWRPPSSGSLPLLYDAEYSLIPAETDGIPDAPIIDETTKNLTDLKIIIDTLIAGTTYYFWVRAKNDIGESSYVGPIQTITDGSYDASDVVFSIIPLDFNTVRTSWTQPINKQLRFTLKRDFGNFTETVVDNDIPAVGVTNTYDDDLLEPETQYDYIFEIRNEFGSLISTLNESATTPDLPVPSLTMTNIGATLDFDVTIPAGIKEVLLEYSLDSTKTAEGNYLTRFTQVTIRRPIGSDESLPIVIGHTTKVRTLNSLYFGHVQSVFDFETRSDFTSDLTANTGGVLNAQAPNIVHLDYRTGGKLDIKIRFEDDDSTGETCIVEFIDPADESGPNIFFTSLERDNPPDSDLDDRENRIEVDNWGNGLDAYSGESLGFVLYCVNQNAEQTPQQSTDDVNIP